MLNVNKKNDYVTWKISIRLKIVKKFLIDRIQLIEWSWIQSYRSASKQQKE